MKLSIITINYNNLNGLKKTIDSVKNQSTQNFDYLVVDGNSNDGSKEYLLENKELFTWMVSEKDSGIYDAMNKGILKAQGEYLLFLNSGDYLCENHTIQSILPDLNQADIIYGNMKIEVNGQIKNAFMPAKLSLKHMLNDTLWHPVSFIKKDLLIQNGMYSTAYKICSDYDFFLKTIIIKNASNKHIKRFVSVFNMDGLSSKPENQNLLRDEKTRIQRTYFTQEVIDNLLEKEDKSKFLAKIKSWFRF